MDDDAILDLGDGLAAALRRVDSLRRSDAPDGLTLATAEVVLEGLFSTSRQLAVYGSLAPGEPNHHHLADVAGSWRDGFVRGRLLPAGWGAGIGYPGMRWDEEGEPVPVKLLISNDLPRHWARLDAFEGNDYRRVLVPVRTESGFLAVANLYEARG